MTRRKSYLPDNHHSFRDRGEQSRERQQIGTIYICMYK